MTDSVDQRRGLATETARTLAELHLEAERSPTRRAVLRWHADGQWQSMPSWRFYRQVIRVALILRDRMGVAPGDRVLVWSPPRTERVVAEWAAVTTGAVAFALEGEIDGEALSAACSEALPKAAFVAGPTGGARVLAARGAPPIDAIVAIDAESRAEGMRSWAEVLDLGGTLDTAERAQSFRGEARSIVADRPAIAYREQGNGSAITLLDHREVMERLRAFWGRIPPHEGDVAYVLGGGDRPPGWYLPLWAFVGDGRTSTAFGTLGRQADEMGGLSPQLFVGPSEIGRHLPRPLGQPTAAASVSRALGQVPVVGDLMHRFFPEKHGAAPRPSLREILTFDGRRVEQEPWRFQ